jgi:hypothetical protein
VLVAAVVAVHIAGPIRVEPLSASGGTYMVVKARFRAARSFCFTVTRPLSTAVRTNAIVSSNDS